MHWADVIADKLLEMTSDVTVATGITPSGHIHVGNMREVISAELVFRAVEDRGGKARFIYIGDTIDPLRKVYPFLDESYAKHVNKPLSEIPCPCGSHKSYAEHFLTPLFESFEKLGIKAETVLSDELYAKGLYGPGIERVIKNKDLVSKILAEKSGRALPDGWYPYTPKCGSCGKLGATVTGEELPFVHYHCNFCGHDGKSDIYKDDGKLPWRLDWPTRWEFLGVNFEPFGKDHATKGGSYDTGKEISKAVHNYDAPFPLVYEWIQLKGKGAMASSLGNVVSAQDMIKMTSPEVLRYLICRVNPERHIDFDPGLGIVKLYDEYEGIIENYFSEDRKNDNDELRMYELSQVSSDYGVSRNDIVPFKHIITVAQLASDFPGVKKIIERGGGDYRIGPGEEKILYLKWNSARYWLENFSPENVRFSIISPDTALEIDEEEKHIVRCLMGLLEKSEWEPESIHNTFYETGKITETSIKDVFRIVYKILTGSERGPRLGFLLASMEKDDVLRRFERVL